ncbi:MAG: glycosyl hydrolase family 8 [Alphaproteobacteria bacterium]
MIDVRLRRVPGIGVLALILVLAGLCGLGAGARADVAAAGERDWATFKARFLQPDGRVIDDYHGGVSHTESQGFGMLFAVAFADREAFERIWAWTDANLRWDGTWLHAWRYEPGSGTPVPDPNNATDGDFFIAWALERAARRWHEPLYAEAARRIARDIRSLLVAEVAGRTVLLPGFSGFRDGERITVNLSYYVFPAIEALIRLDPAPVWDLLRQDGLELLEDARFGHWGLPPDWLQIAPNGEIRPAADRPARFGYDAVRIPLYVVWAGLGTVERLRLYRSFWQAHWRDRRHPGWASLDDRSVAPYDAANGLKAVGMLVEAAEGADWQAAALPAIEAADDYYSAALILLTRVAAADLLQRSATRDL